MKPRPPPYRIDWIAWWCAATVPVRRFSAEPGADKAELVLAVTDADGANVMACHSAKTMGAKRTVARVEDTDLREVGPGLGVDVIIDARQSVAREVRALVRYPGVSDLVEFAGGKLVLVGGRVQPGASFAGKTVAEMRESSAGRWVLVATIRDGEPVVGRGGTRVEVGDHVLLMVKSGDVRMAVELLGIEVRRTKRVVVLGGSRVAQITAEQLLADGYEVVLVEADPVRGAEISRNSDVLVIGGDPTEPELLDRLELGDGDVVVALSGWDEVNLMGCMVARAVGAPHTIARFGRFAVAGLLKDVGIDATVSSRVAAANEILRFIRRDRILSVATFKDTRAEAIEIEVDPAAPAVGKALRDLNVPDGAVIGGFIRRQEAFLPVGDTVIQGGDHLVMLSVPSAIEACRADVHRVSASVFPRIPGFSRRRRGMARRIGSIMGGVVMAVGVLMLPAAATAAFYGEWHDAGWLLVSAAVTGVIGLVGWRWVGVRGDLSTKEAFATAGLTYFVIAVFGALPYLLTGSITDPTDALFEAAAGFTTTGATTLTDPGVLSHGMLIWRAMTQWLGGMGIIVLSIAILPWLGVGGVLLARAETTGARAFPVDA